MWREIGTVANEEAAIALAQMHNDQAENDAVRCPHCLKVLRTHWKAGLTGRSVRSGYANGN